MFFFSWLRNRTLNLLASRFATQHRPRSRFRPGVENLEDRAVPAMLNVTTTCDVLDPNDGLLSFREAVIEANPSNGASTIVVPAGTYTLTRAGADEDGALTGDLDLTGHLTIQGAGASATVIDGAGLDRVFHVHDGGDVTLSGMTIQGGSTFAGGGVLNQGTLTVQDSIVSENYGGGIWSDWLFFDETKLRFIETKLTVRNTVICGNTGGGIVAFGMATVRNSVISGNHARNGGGILSGHTLTLENSIVAHNAAEEGGGGINTFTPSDGGTSTIRNSIISDNTAVYSGGGIWNAGRLTIHDSTVSDNSAGEFGGGIYNDGRPSLSGATLKVHNSNLSGNTAVRGGGIFNTDWHGTVTVYDSTLSGNSATGSFSFSGAGGGICNEFGTLTVLNSTMTANNASDFGGGIYNIGTTLTVLNSTILGNFASVGRDIYNLGDLLVYDSIIGDLYDA